ncbi:uncharacterized protein LOC113312632 [Papaver somniferum]|uniref:uncharacterized protein LOC113312632 n=1 Tax=Papaver somniferum TaxID=3469 RepID=UPI000E703904|nr:uncharacterized protein LOC113312632 [Papaver somniferum]
MKGSFSTSSAVEKIRNKEPKLHWPDQIWKRFLHPSIASNVWKIQQGVYTDDEKLIKKGYSLASKCCICQQNQDSMEHLLWSCSFSKHIWQWLVTVFQFQIPTSFSDILNFAKHKSSIIKQAWITVACAAMRELWFQKNKLIHENIPPDLENFKRRIMSLVFYGGYRMTVGNPCVAGFGVIARCHESQVIGTVSGGTGVVTTYIADDLAIVWAVEWAVKLQCTKILIISHSLTVMEDAKKGVTPWCLQSRWMKAKKEITEIIYEQCYKEVNFSTIELAKQGARLPQGSVAVINGKPSSLSHVEIPGRKYYRLC